jgi:hypothetical protein
MSILDNLEAYIEYTEEDANLSVKLFKDNVCKDCVSTENSKK